MDVKDLRTKRGLKFSYAVGLGPLHTGDCIDVRTAFAVRGTLPSMTELYEEK
jgi:hypothetical protein